MKTKEEYAEDCKVDDIYYLEWGYDCTMVEFYQIVGRPSKYKVVLRRIKHINMGQICASSSYVQPEKYAFIERENEFIKLITKHNIKDATGSYQLRKWNGNSLIQSSR